MSDVLTVKEVAQLLQMHPDTIREHIREGLLPAVALGRRSGYRIRRADLDAYVQERTGVTMKEQELLVCYIKGIAADVERERRIERAKRGREAARAARQAARSA